MKDKIILDLCGGTGAWSKPYQEAGYDVRVITLPDYDITEWREKYLDKVYYPVMNGEVYGILAAPPCTEFAVSGARWWKNKPKHLLENALNVVHDCLDIIENTPVKFWALENPVGRLKRLMYQRLGEPKLMFDPCDYGDPYKKRTLLWGQFNLPIKNPVEPEVITYKDGSKFSKNYGWKTQEERSITPRGFALAFFKANQ